MKFAIVCAIALTITLTVMLSSLAYGAVPDKLECDAQPSVIHATWDDTNRNFEKGMINDKLNEAADLASEILTDVEQNKKTESLRSPNA